MKINIEFDSWEEVQHFAANVRATEQLLEQVAEPKKAVESLAAKEAPPPEPEKAAEPEKPRKRRGRPPKAKTAPPGREPSRDRAAELLIQVQQKHGDNALDLALDHIDINEVSQLQDDEEIGKVCPLLEAVLESDGTTEALVKLCNEAGFPTPATA